MADVTKSKLQTRTLLVANLPVDGHKREIEQFFEEAGPIKKVFLVRNQGGAGFKGLAYITYAQPEDATKAVSQFNNAVLGGKILRVKYSKQIERGEPQDSTQDDSTEGSPKKNEANTFEKREKKDFKKQDKKTVFVKRTKEESEAAKAKSARLIIRNISYQAKDADIRKHFSRFGEVKDVALLKRKDGKMVGCGFVQLDSKIAAMNAIKECNMKPLLGRAIAVDWAIPKDQFTAKQHKPDDEGIADVSTGETTEEQMEDDDDSGVDGKSDEDSSEDEESGEEEDGDSEEDKSEGEDEDDSEEEDDESKEKNSKNKNATSVNNRDLETSSKDVAEGRTLFVKNLAFDASEEDIAEVLGTYGDLRYVLLCMDKLTEHPRGTAFVQYKTREGADACLAAAEDFSKKEDFTLMGRTMYPMRAIGRGDVNKMKVDKEKDKEKKDKRNLYLAREGMIREGTKAASGLSSSDLQLRTHRQRVKQKMLQNFHTFVSMTRLCVHNLPENITDRRLGEIFIENAPDEAKITESKAMLNFKDLTDQGKAKSKGYGFVSFTEHSHALAALRRVNNNPDIFTPDKRPIVEFSLENRTALKARENRTKKSKEKNPVWQEKQKQVIKETTIKAKENQVNKSKEKTPVQQEKPTQDKDIDAVKNNETKENKNNSKRKGKKNKNKNKNKTNGTETAKVSDQTVPDYIGSQAKPGEGTTRAMPTHSGPKIRHVSRNVPGKGKITRKQLRKQEADRKKGKKRPWQDNKAGGNQQISNKKQKTEGLPQVKIIKTSKKPFSKKFKGDAESDKKFQNMVAQYKKKMKSNAPSAPEKRWFE